MAILHGVKIASGWNLNVVLCSCSQQQPFESITVFDVNFSSPFWAANHERPDKELISKSDSKY